MHAADQIDPRPNFVALIYPVVTMGQGVHDWSRVNLMARPQTPAQLLTYLPEQNIPSNAPPMFIAVGRNDKIVYPARNGIAMYDALRAAKIPAELRVFDVGPHGISDKPGTAGGDWPPHYLCAGASAMIFLKVHDDNTNRRSALLASATAGSRSPCCGGSLS